MSRRVTQPIGQKRLTNVAVVRLKKAGMRFEIAAYKNKVLSWRRRIEKDIDEVLQVHSVFSNVSKGVLAKKEDLIAAFGTDDAETICLEILDKGELQVSDKERQKHFESLFRDIACIVAEKCVNPDTQRPYTVSMIERCMHDVHFSVDPDHSAKQQALKVIRLLEEHFPIKRASMRLRLQVPASQGSKLKDMLSGEQTTIEHEDWKEDYSVVCLMDPGMFRAIEQSMRQDFAGTGRLEVISLAVHTEGVSTAEFENTATPQSSRAMQASTAATQQGDGGEQQLAERLHSGASVSERHDEKTGAASPAPAPAASGSGREVRCGTCQAPFQTAVEHREHFRSEWHRHNLKRKMAGLPPIAESDVASDTDIKKEVSDIDDYYRASRDAPAVPVAR
eukprot:jgi/Chlat1/4006/Chrsp26S04072